MLSHSEQSVGSMASEFSSHNIRCFWYICYSHRLRFTTFIEKKNPPKVICFLKNQNRHFYTLLIQYCKQVWFEATISVRYFCTLSAK